jgi:hypothetical protein
MEGVFGVSQLRAENAHVLEPELHAEPLETREKGKRVHLLDEE